MDLIAPAITTWGNDLWRARQWEQVRDAGAIAIAFGRLRTNYHRWPVPRDLLDELGPTGPAAAAHKPFPPSIAWDQNTPANRSVIAIAHCRFNSARMGLPMPKWTMGLPSAKEAEVAKLMGDLVRKHGPAAPMDWAA